MATSDSAGNERTAFLRFARKAAFLLPVLLLAPVVNYTIDPANLFVNQGEEEQKIGAELVAGRNVANFDRYNDRQIAKYLIAHRTDKPDVVVLGSSRTLNMGPYLFPSSHVANASTLGSTIREVIASYQIVHERKLHPDTVVIGIDPWMLNANAYDDRWIAYEAEFDSALRVLGIASWPGHRKPEETQSRLSALFSVDYFQQAIKSLKGREPKVRWVVSPNRENEGFTRVPDGSYIYSVKLRNQPDEETQRLAAKYTAGKVYMLDENARVDSTHLLAISRMLELVKKDGSQPILYLAPYHPRVYENLAADPRYRIVTDAEAALRERAAKLAVPVVGSYNPSQLGLTSQDFYDGHHLKESALLKVFGR